MNPRSIVPVSVVVPVKNEGHQLARCLESVHWAGEIVVVDSQSADDTVAVAERCGARVVQFRQNGPWPKKKNWALENVPFRHEWVLLLDADEVLAPDADVEIARLVTDRSSKYADTGSTGASSFWAGGSAIRTIPTGTCGCFSIASDVSSSSRAQTPRAATSKCTSTS